MQVHAMKKKKKRKYNHEIQILTGASKIVNLVFSVSKCALPTSTVFPCIWNNLLIIVEQIQITKQPKGTTIQMGMG